MLMVSQKKRHPRSPNSLYHLDSPQLRKTLDWLAFSHFLKIIHRLDSPPRQTTLCFACDYLFTTGLSSLFPQYIMRFLGSGSKTSLPITTSAIPDAIRTVDNYNKNGKTQVLQMHPTTKVRGRSLQPIVT
eukprot:scaffold751_cov87-Cylindrotheca_fusiformis.AAC.9